MTAAENKHARSRPTRWDWALAAVLLVAGQIEVPVFGVPGDELAAHALWAAAAIAVAFRRSHPLALVVVASIVLGLRYRYGLTPMGGAVFGIIGLLAIYGAGAYARGPVRSAAYAIFAVALSVGVSVYVTAIDEGPLVGLPAAEWLGQISIYLAAALGGFLLRDRSEALDAARHRAAAVPTEDEAVTAAVAEERTTVARELQALVRASVAAIRADAGLAESALAGSAERTRDALESARHHAEAALSDMRRMLGLLRGQASTPELEHTPSAETTFERVLERVPKPLRDQGMPLLVLAVGVPEAILLANLPPELYGSANVWERVLGVFGLALTLVPRRQLPLLSTLAFAAILLARVAVLDDFFTLNMPVYVAAFAAGAYGRTPALAALGGAIVVAATLAAPGFVGLTFPAGAYIYVVATNAAAWATGFGGRQRLAEAEELHRLAAQEERHRRSAAQRAVAEERLRVARELHDLVGHGVTSIILQCAAGERLAGRDEAQARQAIANVESVASETLQELDELLLALGGAERPASVPSLTEVPTLVAGAQAAGAEVVIRSDDDLDAVPAGPSAAAFRVVQEALTNARKHGLPAGRIEIEITREAAAVEVAVSSELAASGLVLPEGGHGLVGMRERVRVFGGDFSAGPQGSGTWVVRGRIPTGAAEPVAAAIS